MDLANFMVAETLNTALGSKILGSNYPAKYRKHPNLWVKQTYLFLYDSSQKIDYEL